MWTSMGKKIILLSAATSFLTTQSGCTKSTKEKNNELTQASTLLEPMSIDPIPDQVTNTSSSNMFLELPDLQVIFKVNNAVHPIEFKATADQGFVRIGSIQDKFQSQTATYFSFSYTPNANNSLDWLLRLKKRESYKPGDGDRTITIEATDAAGRVATTKVNVKVRLAEFSTTYGVAGPSLIAKFAASQFMEIKVASKLGPSCVDLVTGDVYRQKTPVTRELTFTSDLLNDGSFVYQSPVLDEPHLDNGQENIQTIIYAQKLQMNQNEFELRRSMNVPISEEYLKDLVSGSEDWDEYLVAKSCKPTQKDYSCYAPILSKSKSPGLLYCGSYKDDPANDYNEIPQSPDEVVKVSLCGGRLGRFLAKELNISEKFAFCD